MYCYLANRIKAPANTIRSASRQISMPSGRNIARRMPRPADNRHRPAVQHSFLIINPSFDAYYIVWMGGFNCYIKNNRSDFSERLFKFFICCCLSYWTGYCSCSADSADFCSADCYYSDCSAGCSDYCFCYSWLFLLNFCFNSFGYVLFISLNKNSENIQF